ncbi:MAG TPA: hypothetical protein VI932_02395 [Bacteroidota bacterium]|nr:hypothetical protein [Bacteroidota bacterium]
MAKTNYGYEKRQRDLAKKKKKEEKMQRKLEKKAGKTDETQSQPGGETPVESETGGEG